MGDAVLDKSQVGQGIRQFHVGVAPGEVSTVALLPGDPFRVPMIAEHLTDVREVARVGVTSFIRVGSTGALQPGIAPGDLVVSEGSFRNDGTSAAYVPAGYPGVPDLEITTRLRQEAVQEAEGQSFSAHSGLNVTDDAFYAESPDWTRRMTELGMLNVEMESAALYVVARQRGLRAGMICSVSSNLVEGTSVYDAHDRLAAGW